MQSIEQDLQIAHKTLYGLSSELIMAASKILRFNDEPSIWRWVPDGRVEMEHVPETQYVSEMEEYPLPQLRNVVQILADRLQVKLQTSELSPSTIPTVKDLLTTMTILGNGDLAKDFAIAGMYEEEQRRSVYLLRDYEKILGRQEEVFDQDNRLAIVNLGTATDTIEYQMRAAKRISRYDEGISSFDSSTKIAEGVGDLLVIKYTDSTGTSGSMVVSMGHRYSYTRSEPNPDEIRQRLNEARNIFYRNAKGAAVNSTDIRLEVVSVLGRGEVDNPDDQLSLLKDNISYAKEALGLSPDHDVRIALLDAGRWDFVDKEPKIVVLDDNLVERRPDGHLLNGISTVMVKRPGQELRVRALLNKEESIEIPAKHAESRFNPIDQIRKLWYQGTNFWKKMW